MNKIIEGCPVADGKGSCCRNCGGGWPGTKITTEAMTRAVASVQLDPKKLGCQPLWDRATQAMKDRSHAIHEQAV